MINKKRARKDIVIDGVLVPKGREYWYEDGELVIQCKQKGNGNHYVEIEDYIIIVVFNPKGTKMVEVLIDKDDYNKVSKYTWKLNEEGYIYGTYKGKHTYIQRVIMNTPKDYDTDHINQNKLDNRKCNLRICKHSENIRNRRKYSCNNSGFKGVYLHKKSYKWKTYIRNEGKTINLGTYNKLEDAVKVRREKEIELFGEFACEVHPLIKEEIEFCRQQDIKYGTYNWNK